MARFTALIGLILLLMIGVSRGDARLLPGISPDVFLTAIAKEAPSAPPLPGVTGLIVPHHLLAANLIARGFWAASGGQYERVIVISPDHFHVLTTPFGTSEADLETAFGRVAIDRAAVAGLTDGALVGKVPSLAGEHGIMAIAPFVRHFFPEAKIVPMLAAVTSTPEEWRALRARLSAWAGPGTLVVQSTDFSHYRPLGEAIARDQESLSAIMSGDPDVALRLLQPQHLDSRAALFVQMSLQRDLYHAQPVVLGNGNSVDYGTAAGSTTSYVTAAFVSDPGIGTAFAAPDVARTLFAGDVLLGRFFTPLLHDGAAWARVRDLALVATGGAALVVNLEGVLLDRRVTGVAASAHVMSMDDAAGLLAALKVKLAGLANNHANDLGPDGLVASRANLAALDIGALGHGEVADMGAYRLLALNFVRGRNTGDAIAGPDDLDFVCRVTAAPPLVALVHWGKEYTDVPGPVEEKIAAKLHECGVTAVIGAHSHRASADIVSLGGGSGQMIYSLGNFLFDQSGERATSALAELRVFKHGTVALRLILVPNIFEAGRQALGATAPN